MRLNVRVQGAGTPLLCLHGHPGNGQSMAVFTEVLSQRFRTIAPDLRGYGRSRVHQPFDMAAHLDDLIQLLKDQSVEQCFVLGWSLGGILALELALACPERVGGLILVATAARPRSNHPPVTWQDNVNTAISSLLNRARPGWEWNIQTFGQRSLYRYLLQRHSPCAYRRLAAEGMPAYLQTSRWAHQALNRALRDGYNRLPEMEKIQVPCLVLCSEDDRHITPAASQETARHLLHSTLKTYSQAAHLFPWEIPNIVLRDINEWLSGIMKQNPPLI